VNGVAEIAFVARLVLAVVFALAAVAKLADRDRSEDAVANLGIPDRLAPTIAWLLPVAELAVAAVLVPASTARLGAVGAAALLVAFSLVVALNLRAGNTPNCHCFGQLGAKKIGPGTLVRNGFLAGLAVVVLAAGPGVSAGTPAEWFADLRGMEQAGVMVALALLAVIAGLCWAVASLLRQQGRLLLRLDEIELMVKDRSEYPGLEIGSVAPSFALASVVSGQTLTLEALLAPGRPVALVFVDPNCRPCRKMLPDVPRWTKEHADRLTIVVITAGDPVAARRKAEEVGLPELLVQDRREVVEAYRTTATPSAVLVGPDQRIASPVVAGGGDIFKLLLRGREGVVRRQEPGEQQQQHDTPESQLEGELHGRTV
jgi:thiol-disulfide isomerase/thioredoxin